MRGFAPAKSIFPAGESFSQTLAPGHKLRKVFSHPRAKDGYVTSGPDEARSRGAEENHRLRGADACRARAASCRKTCVWRPSSAAMCGGESRRITSPAVRNEGHRCNPEPFG